MAQACKEADKDAPVVAGVPSASGPGAPTGPERLGYGLLLWQFPSATRSRYQCYYLSDRAVGMALNSFFSII